VVSDVVDAETSQRGYLLTGDEAFLQPSHAARHDFDEDPRVLQAVTTSIPSQQAQVDRLAALSTMRMAGIARTIDLWRQGDSAAATTAVASGRGQAVTGEIRQVLVSYTQAVRTNAQRTTLSVALVSTVACVLIARAAVIIRRERLHADEPMTSWMREFASEPESCSRPTKHCNWR
jgi:CHASE3 domain sensor protein